jgi:hypothetical protein
MQINIAGSIFDSTLINNYYCYYSLRVVQSLLRVPEGFGQFQHFHSWQQKILQSSPLPMIIKHPIHWIILCSCPPPPPKTEIYEICKI